MIKIKTINDEFLFEGKEVEIVKKELYKFGLDSHKFIDFEVNGVYYKIINKYVVSIIFY